MNSSAHDYNHNREGRAQVGFAEVEVQRMLRRRPGQRVGGRQHTPVKLADAVMEQAALLPVKPAQELRGAQSWLSAARGWHGLVLDAVMACMAHRYAGLLRAPTARTGPR